ncbi:hypothetical protein GCM10010348_79030 [Streptomyces anthocyanicus]|uniref:hypothetical protein n=1 Tax=Streptomyces TaxID=1883 RepID=UPI001291E971|nr:MULTISPECIES: hypothetical protein [Streptomyces]GHC39895.1 hypothetical protein GCM10010348_79030 [Streptomyces anthocyanicus]
MTQQQREASVWFIGVARPEHLLPRTDARMTHLSARFVTSQARERIVPQPDSRLHPVS